LRVTLNLRRAGLATTRAGLVGQLLHDPATAAARAAADQADTPAATAAR
jgi:hypothetical protein